MAGATLTMNSERNCRTFARRNPIMVAAAMVLGCALTAACWWYAHMTAPIFPVMTDAPIVTRGGSGTVYIRLRFLSASPQRCLRQSVSLLMRDTASGRTYYNLSYNMGGRNLGGSVYRFDTLQSVPSDFEAGEWRLLTRLHYECEPFGLRFYEHTLPEVKIIIPER